MRPTTTATLILAMAAGAALFQVSFQVAALEKELSATNRNIDRDRGAMRVLRAEWSYLNQPAQLEDLAKRYLRLQPVETVQLGFVEDVPLRFEQDLILAALPGQPRLKPPALHRAAARHRDSVAFAAVVRQPAVADPAPSKADLPQVTLAGGAGEIAGFQEPAAQQGNIATRGRDLPRSFDDVLGELTGGGQ